jgi:hypothetical protein
MSLPQVDLKNVEIDSKDYLYWKAVTYEIYERTRKEKQSDRDRYLVELKENQDLKDEREAQLTKKRLDKNLKVSSVTEEEKQPTIDYDPYEVYRVNLHQPELHLIYKLLDDEISNFTKKTS